MIVLGLQSLALSFIGLRRVVQDEARPAGDVVEDFERRDEASPALPVGLGGATKLTSPRTRYADASRGACLAGAAQRQFFW